jgi:hypothetical protein
MAAIGEIYRGALPPPHVKIAELTRRVNEELNRNLDYRASGIGKHADGTVGIGHMTVTRALARYREVNK